MAIRLRSAKKEPAPEIRPTSGSELSPEIFRRLFVSLDLSPQDNPVIGVTSAIAGEGRTTVALGLAHTLASDLDTMVTLVEVDLERQSLSERFDLDMSSGLSEVIQGKRVLADVKCLVAPKLCLIPGGNVRGDSGALRNQLMLDDPFHGVHSLSGIVILDLPPILSHAYSALASGVADATMLVVRAGVTPADVLREALARFGDRPPRGVVLNGPRSALPSWWPERGA